MILYGYWRSSATWRVRIALQLKGVPYTYVPVHLVKDGGQQHSEAHRSRNPMRQVPVLEWSEGESTIRLTQSVAILEYLEETAEGPALLPSDPLHRARVRQIAEIVNAGIQPLQNLATLQAISAMGGDKGAWGREVIEKGLAAIESLLEGSEDQFYVGDQPSFAECCVIPQLYNARRFGVDMGQFPQLTRVEALCATLPAFIAAHPDSQSDAVLA